MIDAAPNIPVFNVGRPDQRGRRTVRALLGGVEIHRDVFCTDDARDRHTYLEVVRGKAPEVPDELDRLGKAIIAAADAVDAVGVEGTNAELVTYNRITAAELASATYDVQFHIANMLPLGQPVGIFGSKKVLKTSLMCDMAISVASGRPFLGYFPVETTARVAVFSAESGMATLQETLLRQCHAASLRLRDLAIVFSDTVPLFGSVRHLAAFERYLTEDEIGLVFVDPAYLAMLTGGNEGSIFAMGGLLRDFSEICQRVGCTPVLLHHMRSTIADPFSPGDLDHASWAGFAEFCRSWLLINRREKYEPGTSMHRLWLTAGGSIGHSGLWGLDIFEGPYRGPGSRVWDVTVQLPEDARGEAAEAVEAAKRSKRDEKLCRDVRAIVKALAKFPNGETKTIVFGDAGLSGTHGNLALAAAINAGHIVACGVMKGNQKTPREGYKLAPESKE